MRSDQRNIYYGNQTIDDDIEMEYEYYLLQILFSFDNGIRNCCFRCTVNVFIHV